ncbi:MAG: hypothetical protein ACLGI3_04695, partial [Actinomycetes bacterium]
APPEAAAEHLGVVAVPPVLGVTSLLVVGSVPAVGTLGAVPPVRPLLAGSFGPRFMVPLGGPVAGRVVSVPAVVHAVVEGLVVDAHGC